MSTTGNKDSRLAREAEFQDSRMKRALEGKGEVRDKFYFINRRANDLYNRLHDGLTGKRVVVVGSSDCGVTPLARRGVYAEGIDISEVSIEKLNRSIDKEGLRDFASAVVMDAQDLTYEAESIDTITCSGVLHHLDANSALRSWSRCLRPDGAAILFEPLAFHPLAAIFRALTPSMRTPDEHPLRGRDFELMRKYFGSVERHNFGLTTPVLAAFTMIPILSGLSKRALPFFEQLDAVLLRAFPILGRFCWLTVVRLTNPRHPSRRAAESS